MIPNGTLLYFLVIVVFLACNSDNKNSNNKKETENKSQIIDALLQDQDTIGMVSTSLRDTLSNTQLAEQDAQKDSLKEKSPSNDPNTDSAKAAKNNPIRKKVKLKPAITFKELVHDFGTINEGDIIEHKFVFKNTGKAALEIKSVNVSCGCTYPSYPFLDIEPGDTGHIGVTYKSAGKSGFQNPKLTVKTNITNQEFYLHLKGNVVNKNKQSQESEENGAVLDSLDKG